MKTARLKNIARGCGAGLLFLTVSQTGLAQVPGLVMGPVISITSPANHADFFTPVDIPIFARVEDAPRTTNVEFYAGTTDLGPGFSLGAAILPPASPFLRAWQEPRLASVYCLIWTNPPGGSYALTAVNTGSNGLGGYLREYLSRTSAPVNITVMTSTAPRNGPDVVSVVATDPIAISGTNSWVWRNMPNATPSWINWPPPIWQSYTNWGPKDALFTVRRFGDASAGLTVTYSLGGTAANGTNYAALPGLSPFPPGWPTP